MLSPAELSGKEFDKAAFGGYHTRGVDEFLESVTVDYTALYKENAILKQKMKVLVDKIDEYRTTEDSMRETLLVAQKKGESIVDEAKKVGSEMIRQAEDEAKARLDAAAVRLGEEQRKLDAARSETQSFTVQVAERLREQLTLLANVDSLVAESEKRAPAPRPAEPVITQSKPAASEARGDTREYSGKSAEPEDDGDEERDGDGERSRYDFDNLLFGYNYNAEDEK
ncbi:MAG: DivIVA domain-containing protein [Oscillospiraceae bacterium]|jgi:cell division initiation protein|nr:DivIVA domain-containing protein [Oscillospiraceae bacterium]